MPYIKKQKVTGGRTSDKSEPFIKKVMKMKLPFRWRDEAKKKKPTDWVIRMRIIAQLSKPVLIWNSSNGQTYIRDKRK